MAGSNPQYAYDDDLSYYSQQRYDDQVSSGTSYTNQPTSSVRPQYWQQQVLPDAETSFEGYGGGMSNGTRRTHYRKVYKESNTTSPSTYPPIPHSGPHADFNASSSSSPPPQQLHSRRSQSDERQLRLPPSAEEDSYSALPSPSSHSRAPFLPPSPTLSEGFYPDRPIKWDRLNAEQRLIAETFPKDLDEDGKTMRDSCTEMLKDWRHWVKWSYWYYYLACILLLALVIVFVVLHDKIVAWLTPISTKVNSVDWGWIIPVAILFVISFPPLFGHELIGILCGVVYPFWEAFGIVALGTLLGEWGNFWAFGACLQGMANRYERKSLNYACMAHIVREGGLWIILVARLSAIPGHFTTAVFSTVGMSFWMFTLATILSMPKQLAVVYVGYAIKTSGNGEESTTAKIIKWVVLVVTGVITVAAAWYLYKKMELARPEVQKRLRMKRYTLLSDARKAPPSILLKRDDVAEDGFSLVRGTTRHDGERVGRGGFDNWHEGAQGDIGAVTAVYDKNDDDEGSPAIGEGVTAVQLGYLQHHEEPQDQYSGRIPARMASRGRLHQAGDGDQAPQRQLAIEALSGPGLASMRDANASTEGLLPRQQSGQAAFAHGNAPPHTRLQLPRGDNPPQESRSRPLGATAELTGKSSTGVDPLDMNVLLAATTTRATPPRPGQGPGSVSGAPPRPSPPRYETLDWADYNVEGDSIGRR